MKNPDVVGKFLRSAVAAKQYGFEDKLCPIIAKACIEVCPKNPEHFNVDNVSQNHISKSSELIEFN